MAINNEAGMEHLSQRTTRNIDHMLMVTNPTWRDYVAAQRIADLRKELIDIEVE